MVLKNLEDALAARWPQCTLRPFGSFPACLSIFLSDLDVTVHGIGEDNSQDLSGPDATAARVMLPHGDQPDSEGREGGEGEEEVEVSWTLDTVGGNTTPMAGDGALDGHQKPPYDRDAPWSCYSYSSSDDFSLDGDHDGKLDIHISCSDSRPQSVASTPCAPDRRLSHAAALSARSSEKALKQKTLSLLHIFASYLRSLDWAESLELRSRARVPIINIMHRGGVECDISLGMSGSSTSALVERISQIDGFQDTFFAVSAFLKCFLHQLRLDKPFTGGLGSYKLYVMIAYVIVKVVQPKIAEAASSGRHASDVPATADGGFLLMAFLAHFGKPSNLNQYTEIEVLGASADFSGAQLVQKCQQVFMRAYNILRQASDNGLQSLLDIKRKKGPVTPPFSLLCLLLVNSEMFVSHRTNHTKMCSTYCPLLHSTDKDCMGRSVLLELQRKQNISLRSVITSTDLQRVSPLLWERLRSFSSVAAASSKASTEHGRKHGNGRRQGESDGRGSKRLFQQVCEAEARQWDSQTKRKRTSSSGDNPEKTGRKLRQYPFRKKVAPGKRKLEGGGFTGEHSALSSTKQPKKKNSKTRKPAASKNVKSVPNIRKKVRSVR